MNPTLSNGLVIEVLRSTAAALLAQALKLEVAAAGPAPVTPATPAAPTAGALDLLAELDLKRPDHFAAVEAVFDRHDATDGMRGWRFKRLQDGRWFLGEALKWLEEDIAAFLKRAPNDAVAKHYSPRRSRYGRR